MCSCWLKCCDQSILCQLIFALVEGMKSEKRREVVQRTGGVKSDGLLIQFNFCCECIVQVGEESVRIVQVGEEYSLP